jgi:transcriptional regulator with XRE-family HTH domain
MKRTVNERVKVLRTHLNLTQQAFAELVGITSTQLSRIEGGEGTPQKSTLQKIVDATGVSFEWIEHGEGDLKAQVIKREAQVVENPYKDYLVQKLEKDVSTWQQKYDEVFSMLKSFTSGEVNFLKPVRESA